MDVRSTVFNADGSSVEEYSTPIGVGKHSASTDEKGRPWAADMTDRELAEETVVILRATQDLIEKFLNDFSKNPMMGTMLKMFGGR